ncbi:hypothetical protein AAZV13_12G124900 [Glycine max]
MGKVKIGISGFGRIGRLVARVIQHNPTFKFEVFEVCMP